MKLTESRSSHKENTLPKFRVGLIGAGIQASRSPRLHEQEAHENGLHYSYQLFDFEVLGVGVEALPRLLDEAQKQGFAGLNITHPCKQIVIPLLDELSPEAATLGAVNTIVFIDGKCIGHNTDWFGFAESFKRGLPDVDKNKVVLLGAGGAGAAVAFATLKLGIERLAIYDVDNFRAANLAEILCKEFGAGRAAAVSNLAEEIALADGIIQATPIGMVSHPGLPMSANLLRKNLWIAEIVYFPMETEFLKIARQMGCRTMDGGGMAVFQAAESFRLFTGKIPDHERMLRHFATM
jgi:shikimate dehydrogenase